MVHSDCTLRNIEIFEEKKGLQQFLRANSGQQSDAINMLNRQAKGLKMISRQPAHGV